MPRRSADWDNTENRIRRTIEDARTDKGHADDDDARSSERINAIDVLNLPFISDVTEHDDGAGDVLTQNQVSRI